MKKKATTPTKGGKATPAKKGSTSSSATSSRPSTPLKKETDTNSSSAVASSDFEAGILFNRYDKLQTGVLTADDFLKIWREGKQKDDAMRAQGLIPTIAGGGPITAGSSSDGKKNLVNPMNMSFEAGQIFAKFDADGDGRIDKKDFENLLKNYPELLKPDYGIMSSSKENVGSRILLPTEVISGRLLTHYDETAGVALPHSSVERHRSLGNTVVPLTESYRSRYDRLRSHLTGRLLPRREHILQLRRQLQISSTEVAATRKAIERETVTDTEQILERLRSIEAMRQSAIKHQVLQLEEELETIERLVRRVEQANDDGHFHASTGVLVTSAAPGSYPVETIRQPKANAMVELIQQFPELSSNIERLSTKPSTVQTDFPTDDFPKETAERLEILARCDRYVHAVAVKDHMLWSVMKEKERQDELLDEERRLSHEYAQEVAKWAEVSQKLAQQVGQLKQEKERVERQNRELINVMRENNIYYVITDVKE